MANCRNNSTSVQPTLSTACVLPFMQLSQLPSHLLPVHYPFTRPRRRAANPPNLKQQRFHKAFRTTSTGETLLLPGHTSGDGGGGGVTCMRVCLQVDTPTTACASVRAGHGCCNNCTLLPRQGPPATDMLALGPLIRAPPATSRVHMAADDRQGHCCTVLPCLLLVQG